MFKLVVEVDGKTFESEHATKFAAVAAGQDIRKLKSSAEACVYDGKNMVAWISHAPSFVKGEVWRG